MKAKKLIVLAALAVLIIGWMIYTFGFAHTTLSEGPMFYAQAQRVSPITLPPTATNIRIATFRKLSTSIVYMKFEAPLEDCRNVARSLVRGVAPEIILNPATQPSDFPPAPISHHFTPEQLSWFDPHLIADGERYAAAGGDPEVFLKIVPVGITRDPPLSATLYYRAGE